MKRIITKLFTTTGISIVVLSTIVRVFLTGYDLFFTHAVLQTFGANIVIHTGLELIRKLESKYMALDVFLDIAYVSTVLIVFGVVFDWFGITPIWVLILMAATIYIVAFFLNMARVKEDAAEINKLLNKRNKQQGGGSESEQAKQPIS